MSDEDLLDLHGMSLEAAEQTVTSYILFRASRRKIQKVRIVTGRGNHLNARGNRGVIYQNFESWLTKPQLTDRIHNITKGDGYYILELKIKPENDISQVNELRMEEFFYALNTEMFMGLVEQKAPYYLFLYACLLERGKVVERDEKRAFQHYMMAAEAKFDEAIHAVARCYLHGIGTKLNDESANIWLHKADKIGITSATICLADSYLFGRGVPRDERTALSLFAKAAAANNPIAMRKLALAYENGSLTLEKDIEKSVNWMIKAADLYDAFASYNVSVMYHKGKNVIRNDILAFKYARISAKHGDPDGQYLYGIFLIKGIGTPKNNELGIKWLKRASTNGSQQATMQLYYMLPNDDTFLELAVEQGSILSYVLQEKRKGKELSDEEHKQISNSILKKASTMTYIEIVQLDDITRYFFIDELLLSKNKKFSKIAIDALNHMAEHNEIKSIRRLVTLYFNGYHLSRNMQKVLELLQQGIQQDDSKCMITLGFFYLTCTLPSPSDTKPKELFKKSALLNNPNGYFMLAYMQLLLLNANFNNNPNIINLFTNMKDTLKIAIHVEHSLNSFNDLESGIIDIYNSITPVSERMLLLIDNVLNDCVSTTQLKDFLSDYLQNFIRSIVLNLPADRLTDSTETISLFHDKSLSELKAAGDRLASQKNYQAALAQYQEYIKHEQNNERVYCNLGLMHKKLEQNHLAISAFNQALVLKPTYIKALFNLAEIYEKLNQNKLALDNLNQILQLNPENYEAKAAKKKLVNTSHKQNLNFNQHGDKLLKWDSSSNKDKKTKLLVLYDKIIQSNDLSKIKPLIDQGADVDSRDKDCKTALWWAAFYGNAELVKFLLEHKADPTLSDNLGKLPLDIASDFALQMNQEITENNPHADVVNLLKPLYSPQEQCHASYSNEDITALTQSIRKLGLYSTSEDKEVQPPQHEESSRICVIL